MVDPTRASNDRTTGIRLRIISVLLTFLLAAINLVLFRDTIGCATGIYNRCEFWISRTSISGPVLLHESNGYQLQLAAEAILIEYRESAQCHMYAEELERAIRPNGDLLETLRQAPCSSIGILEAAVAAARRDGLVVSKPGEQPTSYEVAYIFEGLVDYRLALYNGDTIVEATKMR